MVPGCVHLSQGSRPIATPGIYAREPLTFDLPGWSCLLFQPSVPLLSSHCLQPGGEPVGTSQPGPPRSLGPSPQVRLLVGQEDISPSGRRAEKCKGCIAPFLFP